LYCVSFLKSHHFQERKLSLFSVKSASTLEKEFLVVKKALIRRNYSGKRDPLLEKNLPPLKVTQFIKKIISTKNVAQPKVRS
jgi:hypothetical protein